MTETESVCMHTFKGSQCSVSRFRLPAVGQQDMVQTRCMATRVWQSY